ncbi:MAG: hypothetical protein WD029_11055, partial [Microthrixaceae bacterium]
MSSSADFPDSGAHCCHSSNGLLRLWRSTIMKMFSSRRVFGSILFSVTIPRLEKRTQLEPTHRERNSGRIRLSLGSLLLIVSLALVGIGSNTTAVSAQESTFTFTGGGWGHAVGMSQWGARGMAANGSSFADILSWYYQGARVTSATTINNDLRVLV